MKELTEKKMSSSRGCLKSKKEQSLWEKKRYKNGTNTSKGKNKIHKNMERPVVLKSEELHWSS